MDTKRILRYMVVGCMLLGVSASIWVFSSSMNPSVVAKAERFSYDISELKPGNFILTKFDRKSAWESKVLFIRKANGRLRVFLLPSEDGGISMPDIKWWRVVYSCQDFGPEIEHASQIVDDGVIRCHDKDAPEWWVDQWVWDYDGKSSSEYANDIPQPSYERNGNIISINM